MRKTIRDIVDKMNRTPIVMVTAYDAWSAAIVDVSVDCILVGDSLGMVVQGRENTIPVTLDEMIYHTKMVMRGSEQACVVCDLPFLSYQTSVRDAILSAGRCLKEGCAQAVKLEGGKSIVPQIAGIVESGMPVVGHLGLTPQSINVFGKYGKQAKSDSEAQRLLEEAKAIEEAGVSMIVLESIPHALARQVTVDIGVPTIGIGAGADCDGQVQVFHDLFGLSPGFTPRHAKQYTSSGTDMMRGIGEYAEQVRAKSFMSK